MTRYADLGASSRQRLLQYLPFLRNAGADVVVSPFVENRYLQHLYATRRSLPADVLGAYRRRAAAVIGARHYSLVWVQKELFPYLPARVEGILSGGKVPYAVDLDDAVFHTYDHSTSPLVRWTLGRKFDRALSGASLVTVGNAYLEDYAAAHGARCVVRVPTVVDINRYKVLDEISSSDFRIGWIGSPATSKYLLLVRDALRALSSKRRIRLVTVGAPILEDLGIPLEQHAWSEATEAKILSSVHVGIMPLPDNPWERGKCGYKLVQYMACARPVVASPVGVNADIVSNGVGFLARNDLEWIHSLQKLADDFDLRRAYGTAARVLVEREFCLQKTAPGLVDLLRRVSRVD